MYIQIIIVILIFAYIGVTEIVPLVRNKKTKELVIYVIFFGTTFILSILYSAGVPLPQVSKGLDAVIGTLFNIEPK
ncbi:hypothetical protein HZI73_19860 [Vallitalea pronyensis]|uniref:Uncharacterized protein n=1 Tax=Vallitalea pronyensis TaxID=1348613 RepID=A0A8J8MMU9_9FIRM|nr:hypothetical protein [Vallitalea pronyensis]QUI24414.1 hypothetical protein HZI73_19860 [Vallitalea pronyensis]